MAILIIENDNKSAELIYDIFINEIRDIMFANDGIQALIAFRKYELSTILIDLEISCIDSIELIKIVKEENPNIKIIAFASKYEQKIIEKLELLSINAFIKKDELTTKLLSTYKLLQ